MTDCCKQQIDGNPVYSVSFEDSFEYVFKVVQSLNKRENTVKLNTRQSKQINTN